MIPESYIQQGLTYLHFDKYCEIGCLASMYMRPSVARNVVAEEGITLEHFQDPKNREIFEIFQGELSAGRNLDVLTIIRKLDAAVYASLPYLDEIIESLTNLSGSNYPYYCQLIREQYASRLNGIRNQEAINLSNAGASPADLAEFNAETTRLLQIELTRKTQSASTQKSAEELVAILEKGEEEERFGFGLSQLDFALSAGGALPGEFLVVGAPTSKGKSTLLLMAALEAVRKGKTVLAISLEMSGPSVLRRMLSNYIGGPILANSQHPGPAAMDARSKAFLWLFENIEKIVLTEDQPSLAQINARILNTKCDLVIIDYIQLVRAPRNKNETREQSLADLVNGLKDLAGRTRKAIFTASQLNDEGALRDSRMIGMAADIVLLIQSDDDKELEIHVRKNRNGAAGQVIPVILRGELGTFEFREV